MPARRIIPCLDVKDGRVVKGVNFVELRDAGDPVEAAEAYDAQGADELCFLDISASTEERGTLLEMVSRVADRVRLPFSVGGGVRSVEDVLSLLGAGADKVCINTAAVRRPELVAECSDKVGSQAIVVAIDARKVEPGKDPVGEAERPDWLEAHPELQVDGEGFEIHTHGGRTPTGIDAVSWARHVAKLGAGELLVTSMDRDGTRIGFDLPLTRAITDAVSIPVIASGGVGTLDHLAEGLEAGGADAVLAASIFHFGDHTVAEARRHLLARGIEVRPPRPPLGFEALLDQVKFDADGLVPAVSQDAETGEVLMVAWADRDALRWTLATGLATWFSRSRQTRWLKGATSGHVQDVEEVRLDCDGDTVLYRVRPAGPACHEGTRTCFSRRAADGAWVRLDPADHDEGGRG